MGKLSIIVWIGKYLVFPALLAGVILAALAGYMNYYDSRVEAFLGGGSADRQRVKDTSIVIPPPPVAPLVKVDSYPRGSEYALSKWKIIENSSGFIDWVAINDEQLSLGDVITLKPGDIIEIGGWAGLRPLGMRFFEVLASSCDKIFAGTRVEGVRPDIAETVHPNLMYSGWTARLYADDIPRCENAMISAWGRLPVGDTLRPLNGALQFVYDDQSGGTRLSLVNIEPLILPENVQKAKLLNLEVKANDTSLRRCASIKCEVVANLASGTLRAVLIEEMDGWYLLQSAKGSGWVLSTSIVMLDTP